MLRIFHFTQGVEVSSVWDFLGTSQIQSRNVHQASFFSRCSPQALIYKAFVNYKESWSLVAVDFFQSNMQRIRLKSNGEGDRQLMASRANHWPTKTVQPISFLLTTVGSTPSSHWHILTILDPCFFLGGLTRVPDDIVSSRCCARTIWTTCTGKHGIVLVDPTYSQGAICIYMILCIYI